ncbi:hypothetical protein RHECNPAF_280080 [Rhizobium etli CNPAF512]|nr:hypothetical protein RHECNPAF_280080 [Rhizobium etli CNPAF512]
MTAAPSSWAGTVAKAPLNEPTAVRPALAMTTDELLMGRLLVFRPTYIRGNWQSFEHKSNAKTGRRYFSAAARKANSHDLLKVCRIAQRDCHRASFAFTV